MNSTQSSSNSATDKNPKVVVLAGWLGCQPKHLRRYSQLYKQNGWDSLIRICSPKSVVMEAMTTGPTGSTRWSNKSVQSSSEIKDLAMNTLQELHTLQPSHIIIHAFSNNGCFLWEWLRFLLYDDNSPLLSSSTTNETADVSTNIDIQNLRQNLIGIIFDSAPAYYGGKTDTLQSALQYVSSVSEQKHLQNYVTTSLPQGVVKQRFRDFWYGLCSGGDDDDDDDDAKTNSIPQLYLYSQCDKLASFKHLEDLIAYREKMLLLRNNGKKKRKNNGTSMSMIIWKHKFDESEHCCHLLKYPEMYDSLIRQFLGFCTTYPCGSANGMCNTSSNLYDSLRSRL